MDSKNNYSKHFKKKSLKDSFKKQLPIIQFEKSIMQCKIVQKCIETAFMLILSDTESAQAGPYLPKLMGFSHKATMEWHPFITM